MEEWKRYKDTDYWVSSEGKVKHNGKEVGCVNNSGYVVIRFGRDGGTVKRNVMVAQTFLGAKDGYEVHHINGIKSDDRIENLLVCSPLQHQRLHNKSLITARYDLNWNLMDVYNSISEADEDVGGSKHLKFNSIGRGRKYRGYNWIVLDNLPESVIFASDCSRFVESVALLLENKAQDSLPYKQRVGGLTPSAPTKINSTAFRRLRLH